MFAACVRLKRDTATSALLAPDAARTFTGRTAQRPVCRCPNAIVQLIVWAGAHPTLHWPSYHARATSIVTPVEASLREIAYCIPRGWMLKSGQGRQLLLGHKEEDPCVKRQCARQLTPLHI